jgi:hypothetical protein
MLPLVRKEGDEFLNDLIRRLSDEPVAGALNDDAFDILGDQPALIDEKLATGLLAGEHEHWHRKLSLSEFGKILAVLFERFEHLETGAHRPRLGLGFRVNPPITFRY